MQFKSVITFALGFALPQCSSTNDVLSVDAHAPAPDSNGVDVAVPFQDASAEAAVMRPPVSSGNVSNTTLLNQFPTQSGSATCEQLLTRRGVSLRQIMQGCPELAQETRWTTTRGAEVSYPDWSDAQKNQIERYFDDLNSGVQDLGLPCHDPELRPQNPRLNYYTEAESFALYAVHVAHVFSVERQHLVPWSILSYTPQQRGLFLASKRYFARQEPWARLDESEGLLYPYSSLATEMKGLGSFCDPRVGYRFMSGASSTLSQRLIGSTPSETVDRLTLWGVRSLVHDNNALFDTTRRNDLAGRLTVTAATRSELVYDIQDDGRIVANNTRRPVQYIPLFTGCHSSARLIRDLARSVLVPIEIVQSTDADPEIIAASWRSLYGDRLWNVPQMLHAGLVYYSDTGPLYLPHTDELYNNPLPSFSRERDGSVLTEDALAHQVGIEFWRTPSDLRRRGFNVQDPPSIIPNGTGLGRFNAVSSTGIRINIEDFGPFMGHWNLADGERYTGRPLAFYNIDLMRRRYDLGTWDNFIQLYCGRPDVFEGILSETAQFDRMGSVGVDLTPADFSSRAANLVMAYGGCRALNSLATQWQNPGSINSFR